MCTGRIARVRGERRRIGVGEHRQGLVDQDRVVRRDERVGRDDDFIAGVHAHDMQAGDQCGGAAGRGKTTPGTQQLRVGGLEFRHLAATTAAVPSPAPQHLEDIRLP